MALPSNKSKDDSSLQTQRARRSINYVLPTLRVLFRPKPGLGLDARLPFNKQVRWYMSLESYFSGTSAVRFGIESTKFPFIRFQCAPEFTLVSNGQVPKLNLNGLAGFYDGLKKYLKPVCELQRHASIGGLLLSDKQRRALRDALEKAKTKSSAQAADVLQERDNILKNFKGENGLDYGEKARMAKDLQEKLNGSWKDRPLHRETLLPDVDKLSPQRGIGSTEGSLNHE